MADFISDANRKLIPRWRSSEVTQAIGELYALPRLSSPPSAIRPEDFADTLATWKSEPSLSSAGELVAAAFVHGRSEEAREAAEYILEHRSAPGLLPELASRIVHPFQVEDPDDTQRISGQIHYQRQLLSLEPRNPFKWVDLARNFVLIGRPVKARRAIEVALTLAPNNRFVVRSATRLFLHLHEPERALNVLTRTQTLSVDPLLMAPEISVSALLGKRSRLLRRGLTMVDSGDFDASHIGELAAAIATEELAAGPSRRSRKLFTKALIRPGENTVAQVRWAAQQDNAIEFSSDYLKVERSFEARAWHFFSEGEWAKALVQAKAWLGDQAFSRRPAGLGSFVAAVAMNDHLEAIAIARRGLLANPTDPVLNNNLAYSLACSGDLIGAELALSRVVADENESAQEVAVLKCATSGLIQFRKGDVNGGRARYEEAACLADKSHLAAIRDRVWMFLAYEEARAGNFESPVVQEIINRARRLADPVIKMMCDRVLALME